MRTLFRSFAIVAALLTASVVDSSAQSFDPTTTWPYVYRDFMDGQLLMTSGKTRSGQYNICLATSSVHFIDGAIVKEAMTGEISSLQIGGDVYVNASGRIMKAVARTDKGLVAVETTIDMLKLNETGGAYGSSSSSNATMALSSLEGIGGTRSNMNHMELKNSRDAGKVLPLVTKYYLVFDGKTVFAGKKDVDELDGVDKEGLKDFYKTNKIKWRDPQSLCTLLDFLAK